MDKITITTINPDGSIQGLLQTSRFGPNHLCNINPCGEETLIKYTQKGNPNFRETRYRTFRSTPRVPPRTPNVGEEVIATKYKQMGNQHGLATFVKGWARPNDTSAWVEQGREVVNHFRLQFQTLERTASNLQWKAPVFNTFTSDCVDLLECIENSAHFFPTGNEYTRVIDVSDKHFAVERTSDGVIESMPYQMAAKVKSTPVLGVLPDNELGRWAWNPQKKTWESVQVVRVELVDRFNKASFFGLMRPDGSLVQSRFGPTWINGKLTTNVLAIGSHLDKRFAELNTVTVDSVGAETPFLMGQKKK